MQGRIREKTVMSAGDNEPTPGLRLKMVVTAENFADLTCAAPARIGVPKPSLGVMIAFVIVGVLATLAWLQFVDAYGPKDKSAAIDVSTIAILSSFLGALLMILCTALRSRTYLKDFSKRAVRDRGVLIGPQTLTLSDEGITIEGANVRSLIRWLAVQDISESGETILIWTDPGAAIIVPKSAFPSDNSQQKFMANISKRIQKNPQA